MQIIELHRLLLFHVQQRGRLVQQGVCKEKISNTILGAELHLRILEKGF